MVSRGGCGLKHRGPPRGLGRYEAPPALSNVSAEAASGNIEHLSTLFAAMVRPLYELRREVQNASRGEAGAAGQALDELEALFRAARAEGRLSEFLEVEAQTVFDAIATERAVLTRALLRWLPADEFAVLVQPLCSTVRVHYLQVKVAIAFDLAGSDGSRAEAVAFRLVARLAPPAVSIGWLLSLVATHGKDEKTAEAANELMAYHAEELPMSTEQLLANDKNPLVKLEFARDALEHLREYNAHLEQLPRARELDMPAPMRLMYASIRRERHRTISAGGDKRSFFASMFTTHRFKYSSRAAVEVHHGGRTVEKPLTMTPFSVSMELPVSDLADPVAAHFQLQDFNDRGKR